MWVPDLAYAEIDAGTLNLGANNFYVHLLLSQPAFTVATASQLSLPTGAGYTRGIFNSTFTSNKLTATQNTSFDFDGVEDITYWAVCQGAGVGTDRVCLVSALRNIDFSIMPSIRSEGIGIELRLTGLPFLIEDGVGDIRFTAVTVIQPLPSASLGIFELIRTNNGTATTPPTNAVGTAATAKILFLAGTVAASQPAFATDRNASNSTIFNADSACYDLDFYGGATGQILKLIRPGNLILRYSTSTMVAGCTLTIKGSNNLAAWTAANVQDDAQHSVLHIWNIPNTNVANQEIVLPVGSNTFWRYLGFEFNRPSGSATLTIHEMEFSGIGSQVSSNTGNL